MEDLWERLLEHLDRHRGKVIGAIVGLLVGWLIIEYGLIKTLFLALCLVVGVIVGRRFDGGGSPFE